MVYEDPVAYLVGVEGMALLRAFTGEHDRAFTDARLAEVRALLARDDLTGVEVEHVTTVEGYAEWAATYDEPRNGLFDFEEPIVHEIVDALPPGDAIDAACGTGRYARHLAGRGHRVVGVDSSAAMLATAAGPGVEVREGELHQLPVRDDAADLVVCALALTHLPALEPAFAEFARVLRPGGHLVISDAHHESVALSAIPTLPDPPRRVASHLHRTGDYLRAALPHGFQVRRCEEPRLPKPDGELPAASTDPGPWQFWPWSLAGLAPEAAAAANAERPVTVVWHLQLP